MRYGKRRQASATALLVAAVVVALTAHFVLAGQLPIGSQACLGQVGLSATGQLASFGEPTPNISRSTIAGGGGMDAVGGLYELSATIGQPEAGVLAGGGYLLSAAFWFPVLPGDAGEDGDIDLADYAEFLDCSTGPGGGPPVEECEVFDVDYSGTIDLGDFAVIQRTYTGP